jgi:hypothetical protein
MLLHPHVSASSFLLGAVGEKERQGKASNCVKECVSKRNKGVSKRDKRQVTVSLFACVYRQESRRGHGQPSANVREEVVLSSTSVATRSSGWKGSLKVAVPMAGGPFRSAPLPLPPPSFLLPPPSFSAFLSPTLNRSLARSLALCLSHKHKHKHTQMQDGGISGIWLGGNPLAAKAGGVWSGAGGQTATRIANFSLYGGYISDAGTYLRSSF